MRWRARSLVLIVSLVSRLSLGTEGVFQGTVVDPPRDQPAAPGWIFVEGGNHLLRKVEVSHAEIVFGAQVPAKEKHKCGPECLAPGQEVRVTAEQDQSGEWRARRVEILRTSQRQSGSLTAADPRFSSASESGIKFRKDAMDAPKSVAFRELNRSCWITKGSWPGI